MAMLDIEVMRSVAEVLKAMYKRGLVQVKGGNVSVYSGGLVYISPSGVPRHKLEWSDVAVMDLEGGIFRGRPSSEWRMHVAIYRKLGSKGVSAVVHAHPKTVLALDAIGVEPEVNLLAEAKIRLGCVARVPFITPGTWDLAEAVAQALNASGCRAVIMERHGAVTVSSGLWDAVDAMESLEDLAWIALSLASSRR